MLDDKDIEKLKSVFGTKEDLTDFRTSVQNEFNKVHYEVDGLRESLQGVISGQDGIAKSFEKLDHEYLGLNDQVIRHEKWHHQTAEKVGIVLEV